MIKRDLAVERRATDTGALSYEMLNMSSVPNDPEYLAYRFSKLLLSDAYGGLLREVRMRKTEADIEGCLRATHSAMVALSVHYPRTIYTKYSSYLIRNVSIDTSSMTLVVEVDVILTNGGSATVII